METGFSSEWHTELIEANLNLFIIVIKVYTPIQAPIYDFINHHCSQLTNGEAIISQIPIP